MGLIMQRSNQQGALADVLDYYDRAAKGGQLQAMNNHGFLLAGTSTDPDKQKAGIAEIKLAAEKGLGAAKRNMAQIILNGMAGQKPDPKAALALLDSAKGEKGGETEWMLYQFHAGGGGKENANEAKAIEYLNAAAKAGNPNALDTLGNFYLQGASGPDKKELIKPNPGKAIEMFKELADAGNPVGLRKMAGLYQGGAKDKDGKELVKQDFDKSLEYYGKAAQGGDAVAQFQLASMFATGVKLDPKSDKIEVAPNANYALQLFKLAAQNNMPLASFYVGNFYEQGTAVDRDLQRAFQYYMQAAQSGVAVAFQKVADFYANGAGTMKDPVAAAGWYARSAAAGSPEGMLSMGLVSEAGLAGGESPAATAQVWYTEAYRAGAVQSAAARKQNPDAQQVPGEAVALNAYLRLASLHDRGLLGPKGEAPKQDLKGAYVHLRLADAVAAGKNKSITDAIEKVAEKLSKDEKSKADDDVAAKKKQLSDYVEAQLKKMTEGPKPDEAAAPAAPAAPATPPATPKKGKK
jgi:TPR repeat protein